jgi:hypothetical protein
MILTAIGVLLSLLNSNSSWIALTLSIGTAAMPVVLVITVLVFLFSDQAE